MWPDGDAALYIWGGTRDPPRARNESKFLSEEAREKTYIKTYIKIYIKRPSDAGTRDKGRSESEYLTDLWRLDTSTWGWERVACPPSTGPGGKKK